MARVFSFTGLALLGLLLGIAPAAAQLGGIQPPGRFIDVVDVSDRGDQVDITVQFNCTIRYVTHLPASQGKELRVQLQPLPDCGVNPMTQISGELAPLSGGTGILDAVRIEANVPGQLTMVVDFVKSEQFVIAQGVDPRGLRIRLLDRAPSHGKVLITQSTDTVNYFAINLDSQTEPFDPQAVQLAHERLQVPVFVSEVTLEGQQWYRLRAGPIDRQSEAERLLNRALPDYPRAWLAIGDDAITSDPNAPVAQASLPGVQPMGSDAALPAELLKSLLTQARAALTAKDYPKAIALLTKLQRQPEFPGRAPAQELLGLARERSGQLAHAKAEYLEYLRRYPQGEAAERVAARLRTLQLASAQSHAGAVNTTEPSPWQMNGGFAQLLRYDGTRVSSTTSGTTTTTPGVPPLSPVTLNSSQTDTSNSLYNDVDLFARRRGESIDFLSRLSAGFAKDFGNGDSGSFTRVSLASAEVIDHPLGLLARLGRQISTQDGILGTFDGLFLAWQFKPSWSINAAAGYPVLQTNSGPQTDRHFETVALAYSAPGSHWDGDVFATTQQFDGVRDRQAVGFDARYLSSALSLIGLLDYDTAYHSLNAGALMGTWQLPARWNLSFDAERRNSPPLTTYNALIGQPYTTLVELEQHYSLQQIYQFAVDRTSMTSNYSLTATHPLGERFQFAAVIAATDLGATPASAGVPAEPGTGLDLTYQAQLYATSLWHSGDFNLVTVGYGNTEVGKLESVAISSRFPVSPAWRIGPRLLVERDTIDADSSTEILYIPSMLLDYQRGRSLVQAEFGGEIGKRDAALQTQDTRRYYVTVAYRINF